jgi:hypothetical protein
MKSNHLPPSDEGLNGFRRAATKPQLLVLTPADLIAAEKSHDEDLARVVRLSVALGCLAGIGLVGVFLLVLLAAVVLLR